ncbi:MAG: polymerase III, subunit gamma and tau protein [Microgenomates group bacterium GW2011_GWC1_39_7b]|uniref:DNA polymerase III subunit gamma/tau n=1 Tax=Candidatus Daviesbacteria bacterium RIFOXYD1_FULL_41_10 TaxID=1797801 RepID=A0A1F5N1C4_9BACT|nr:MAG: polymerase III, subunit gamma and tau protein [Microgenomates group bacterium GW2011_GWC1_39_7b]OGE71290.1 MAG: DNA polymerase III, subunit gamma and tau [Candidatus Daviesbacteria bacterium RIFOXYD1_FULL_41_10]
MVLYRKYRPQTLDEIIGQESVKVSLQSAVTARKLSHAYLFCGPRGTGKTSMARILAKIVNCQSVDTLPCNKCTSCISITDGTNMDVVEMDAASNRGIDDIRTLRENIKLAPTTSHKKVYIIDEVHMLSTEAFNALLKTLEEPPSHVLFILATTEAHKIPSTILSRVSKLEFKPATNAELISALTKVAKAEKININSEALGILAKRSGGSFRDGIKLLDLLSPFDSIDASVVEKALGQGAGENILEILRAITKKDANLALQKLSDEIEAGANVKELALAIMETLRQILLAKHGMEQLTASKELVGEFEMGRLIATIDAFQKSFEVSKYASIPSLPLEMAVVESCMEKVQSEKCNPSTTLGTRVKSENRSEIVETGMETRSENSDSPENRSSGIQSSSESFRNDSPDLQRIADRWTYILETVRAYNFSLEALLRSSKIQKVDGGILIIEVPYSFHQRIMDAPKSRDLLESVMSDVLGKSVKVSTVLGQRPMVREEIANIEVAEDDEIIRLASEIFNSETVN